jgi:hypothetical protein
VSGLQRVIYSIGYSHQHGWRISMAVRAWHLHFILGRFDAACNAGGVDRRGNGAVCRLHGHNVAWRKAVLVLWMLTGADRDVRGDSTCCPG